MAGREEKKRHAVKARVKPAPWAAISQGNPIQAAQAKIADLSMKTKTWMEKQPAPVEIGLATIGQGIQGAFIGALMGQLTGDLTQQMGTAEGQAPGQAPADAKLDQMKVSEDMVQCFFLTAWNIGNGVKCRDQDIVSHSISIFFKQGLFFLCLLLFVLPSNKVLRVAPRPLARSFHLTRLSAEWNCGLVSSFPGEVPSCNCQTLFLEDIGNAAKSAAPPSMPIAVYQSCICCVTSSGSLCASVLVLIFVLPLGIVSPTLYGSKESIP